MSKQGTKLVCKNVYKSGGHKDKTEQFTQKMTEYIALSQKGCSKDSLSCLSARS